MRRTLVALAVVVLASCGGGGSKSLEDETDCSKLSDRLVALYSNVTEAKADEYASSALEVGRRMDALNCP